MITPELKARMAEVLQHVPEARHSYFQLQHFVIGKEPTLQGQMWQCLRELQVRNETIEALRSEIEDAQDRLELVEINMVRSPELGKTALEERENTLRLRRLGRKRNTIHKSIRDLEKRVEYAEQEAKFFLQMFEALNKQEKVKDFDNRSAQEEYWNERIAQQINLKTLLQQPIDTELALTALALHQDAPIRIQMERTLTHVQDQMHRLKNQYVEHMKAAELRNELRLKGDNAAKKIEQPQ